MVKVHSAHPHRIATYDERGVQTTGGEVVLVLLEFCPGGSIEDHLGLLRGVTETTNAAGEGGGRDRDSDRSRTNRDSLGTLAVEPRRKRQYTTGDNWVSRAEEGEGSLIEGSIVSDASERKAEVVDRVGAIAPAVPARRLEVWVRQVRACAPTPTCKKYEAYSREGRVNKRTDRWAGYVRTTKRAREGLSLILTYD